MRAKTKKDLIIQGIVGALIVYVLFLWHPDTQYRTIIKGIGTVLGALMYGVINKLWKWKEADEDDTPLWWETSKQSEATVSEEVEDNESLAEPVRSDDVEAQKHQLHADRNWNMWVFGVLLAIAVLFAILMFHGMA